jgi:hypothetical protein
MQENETPMQGDLGAAFESLKQEMFITYNGCRLEKLGHDEYKWNGHTGTLVEIGAKIREMRLEVQKSIDRSKEIFENRLKTS